MTNNVEEAVFGMGCYWGAERQFWQYHPSLKTAVGFAGGLTINPTYKEVCTGLTNHAEVVTHSIKLYCRYFFSHETFIVRTDYAMLFL